MSILADIVARAKPKPPLTQARLKELLDYDPDTGIFRWKVDRITCAGRLTAKAGDEAGRLNNTGRGRIFTIIVDSLQYNAGALVLLYMTGELPTGEPDHIDRNPSNNRFNNIRSSTRSQNGFNRRLQKNNTSGAKGIRRKGSGYEAYIKKDRKQYYLGIHPTEAKAIAARRQAAERLFGEFAGPTEVGEFTFTGNLTRRI